MATMAIKDEINAALKSGNLEEAAMLIRRAMAEGAKLDGSTVTYAHVLLLSAPWREITALLPRDTNSLFVSGWLNSIARGRPIDAQGAPVPWLTYPAIDFIETILDPNWRVFEWGSGNSTLWWSRHVQSVRAAENNLAWQKEVSAQMPPNAEVIAAESQEDYVSAPLNAPEENFDVIVIDGSHRSDCARVALEKLSSRGIIIFDNSDSLEHTPGVQYLDAQGLHRIDFWGLIPSYLYRNCTSIYLRDTEILKNRTAPSAHKSCTGISCMQAMDRNKAAAKG